MSDARSARLRFDPGQGHRDLERWRQLARPFFELRPLTDAAAFIGRARFAKAGRLVLSRVTFSPQRMEHEPRRLMGFDHCFLLFERYHDGCGRGLVDGEATRIDTGSMHLVDMSRHYLTMTSAVAAEGVLIPHSAVGYDPSRHRPYVTVAVQSPYGRALAAGLGALLDAVKGAHPADAADLGVAFCDLVRSHLLGEPKATEGENVRGRSLLLHAYIRRHLDDPDLTIERLCCDLGLSRATLYRLFAAQGGVRRYITGQQLERCFVELLQAPAERGQVRRIAERWGFYDAASFNHRFRQRFGFAPSDCMGQVDHARGIEAMPVARSTPDTIIDWMRLR